MNTAKINAALQMALDDLKAKQKDLTAAAYKGQVNELQKRAEEAREQAKQPLRAVLEEYTQAVREWSRPDGGQLDQADLQLMNIVKLDEDGFQALAEKHKNNWIMSMVVKGKAQEAGFTVMHVQYPGERIAIMTELEARMEHSLSKYFRMMDSKDRKLKDTQSYLASCARDCLEKLQPIEDETFDMDKYVVEYAEEPQVKGDIW